MSTKYPASAVLMELSANTKKMRMKALVDWTPRTANGEADTSANGDDTGFNPARRVHISASSTNLEVLPEALRMGYEADIEGESTKEKGTIPDRSWKQRKRKSEEKPRISDPW